MLDGFTIGVTADRRWEEQASLFERRGAAVQHGPTIRTLPLGAEERLRVATTDVMDRPPRFLIANTGIGIRSWFAAAESWGLDDELRDALVATAIYARGPKASAAVHAHGLEVVAKGRSERLAEAVVDGARGGRARRSRGGAARRRALPRGGRPPSRRRSAR